MKDLNYISTRAKSEYEEFVSKFGPLLASEFKPDFTISELRKDSDILGWRDIDDISLGSSDYLDVDYKSLCVTFYAKNNQTELSAWVEVWDDCNVVGFLDNGEFKPNNYDRCYWNHYKSWE